MRILMLSWEYPPRNVGGLGRHVQDLSEALVTLGNEVHVLTPGDKPQEETIAGVTVHRLDFYPLYPPDFLTGIMQLNLRLQEAGTALMLRRRFQIIHAHDWLVAFSGRALKHAFRLPLVATIHATEAGRNHGLHNPLQHYINSVEWWLTFEAWRVIVCSRHMLREVEGLFSLPEDKVQVVFNGVDPGKYRPGKQEAGFRQRYAAAGEKIIFYVGRLVREKGVHVLLEAAPMVLAACPQAKFVIAGSGPMEAELRRMADNLGLGAKIYFTGFIDDRVRNALYREASVAVFPSLYEPFGIVALEAMATDTVVVTSDSGGFSEIVDHGQNGLRAYVDNPRSLADSLILALSDETLAARLRKQARADLAQKYSWDGIARQTQELYQQVWHEYKHSKWVKRKNSGPKNEQSQVRIPYNLVPRRVEAINLQERGRNW